MSEFGYDIKTPKDLLHKAEREFSRFYNQDFWGSDECGLADHALNCAISLWHIVDWLWKSPDPQFKPALAALGIHTFENLHEYVRKQCFALDVCYELATGAKHFKFEQGAKSKRTPLVAETIATAITEEKLHALFCHTLKITLLGGQELMAKDVLRESIDYWRQFLSVKPDEINANPAVKWSCAKARTPLLLR